MTPNSFILRLLSKGGVVMFIYVSKNLDGSRWRARSLYTELLFSEETYRNKKLPASEIKFTNEPIGEDYDALCKSLSGEVVTYHIPPR